MGWDGVFTSIVTGLCFLVSTGALLTVAVAAVLLSAAEASRNRRQLASDVLPPPRGRRPLPGIVRRPSPPRRNPAAGFTITDSILKFTAALSDHVSDGNVLMSPFSIVSVLNLLLLGATGSTYDQLRAVLRYPDVEDLLIHQQCGLQLRALRREKRGINVQIANRIFTDAAFRVNEAYSRKARDFYQAGVEQLEFGTRPAPSARRINQWVSDHTAGQIEKIFDNPPPRNTRMIGANVVYFNSSWQTPFDETDTKPLSFHLGGGQRLRVPMMFAELTVPHVSYPSEGFSAVLLPYSGGDYAMAVLLPDQAGEEPLRRLEQKLAGGRLGRVFNDMKATNLSVWLPRFKMEYSIALRDILQDMGVVNLFQESQATLDRLSPDNQLFLNEVLHQAVIDVNEAGTEASAVTVTLVNRDRLAGEFRANKPFLFVIRDGKTGVPLFYGRMVRPEEGVPQPGKGRPGAGGFGGRPSGGGFGSRPGGRF